MITPETASQALSSWLAYLQITQETATQLITRAFLEQPARAGVFTYGACRVQGLLDVGGKGVHTNPVGTKIRPSRKPRQGKGETSQQGRKPCRNPARQHRIAGSTANQGSPRAVGTRKRDRQRRRRPGDSGKSWGKFIRTDGRRRTARHLRSCGWPRLGR